MTDVFDKEKRSEIMSRIRGKGSRSTEGRMKELLQSNGITGWREGAKDIFGKPDFVFDEERIVIFVDGCFWHGCPNCRNIPADNREFWEKKINRTKERDSEVKKRLEEEGWIVLRVWEHQLKKKNLAETLNLVKSVCK